MATQLEPRPASAAAARPERPAGARLADRWPLALLLVPLALVCVGFWPGHMSSDTLSQIGQVMSFDLTNQHAPLIVAVWKPFFELGAGPGWVLTAQVAAFLLGCYLVLRVVFGRLAASLGAVVIALWPAVFGMLGYVSRDTWFAALLVLTFGIVARCAQGPPRRGLWIAAAVVVAWFALAARQNAAPSVALALVVLVAALPVAALHRGGRRRRLLTSLAGGIALTAVLMGSQVVAGAALGVRDVAPEQYLYVYDLGHMSVRDGVNRFPREVMPERRSIEELRARVNPDSVVSLVWAPDAPLAPTPLDERRLDLLADAWRDEVRGEPDEYLDVRADLLLRNLAITAPASFVYHPVIDPNPWGYAPTFPEANDAAKDYVEGFTTQGDALAGTLVHRVWAYLLLAVLAAALLLRRGRPLALAAIGALGLTALAHQAGLLLGTPQNGFRLEFPVVVTGMLCAAVAAGALRRARSARAGAPAPR